MRTRYWPIALAAGVLIAGAAPTPTGAQAQRGAGAAATPAGPTPRLSDGTPNLGRVPGEKGVWDVRWVPDLGDRVVGHEVPPGQRKTGYDPNHPGAASQPWVPTLPWSAAVYDYNLKNQGKYDPEGFCLPPGGPRMMVTPYPMEIVQIPEQKRILMIFEGATHIWREIYMDGREHPKGDALNPTYLGHSVGHWEGDTLVVDVVGFNENSWLDPIGHPHTDMLHLVEKFTRTNKNTLHYEVTIDDPGAYKASWTVGWDIAWRANAELTEYICQENNKYLRRLTDDFGRPVFDAK